MRFNAASRRFFSLRAAQNTNILIKTVSTAIENHVAHYQKVEMAKIAQIA